MQDFLDDLERRLSQVAEQDAPAPKPARSPRNFRRRRPAILGGLTAALAASVAAFTMTGTSLADLPILQTDTENASQVARAAPQAAKAGVDFSKAHPFGTPGGPGYALVNEQAKSLCIAVPDPDIPASYGVSCEPSLAAVKRRGMSVALTRPATPSRPASVISVVVLPEDADDVSVESAGRRSTPRIESGVVVVELDAAGRVTWSVDGRPGAVELVAPMRDSGVALVTCPDGSRRTIENPPARGQNEASRDALRERTRAACRR